MGDRIPSSTETSFQMPESVEAETLIAQLKAITANPDILKASDAQKHEIKLSSRRAAYALEQPFETMMRIAYAPMPLVTARIGQDHNIFTTLAAADKPITLSVLSASTGMEIGVLESVMDYLCSQNMAREVKKKFVATRLTHVLTNSLNRATFTHHHDAVLPGWWKLNAALHEKQASRTAWQMAMNTELDFYGWLDSHPVEKSAFHHFMEDQFSGLPSWLDAVDFEYEFGVGLRNRDVAFVDVGGGIGQQCEAFKKKFPGLPGRVILQDLPGVVANALKVDGMEAMSYDYLTAQPIQGARVYYLRQIMHNNTDSTSIKILRCQMSAMSAESVIIIDEKVLPKEKLEPDAPGAEFVAGLSLAMKMIFNAQERREVHWRRLLGSAGLVVKEIRKFSKIDDCIIICVKGEGDGAHETPLAVLQGESGRW